MNNPIWKCDAETHGRDCQCGKNLRKQLDLWREQIVNEMPDLKSRVYKPTVYTYPVEPCPYCGYLCECDMVDVGVGLTQCGPFYCERCHASQVGPEGFENLTGFELITGWYEPDKPVSPYANTLQGVLVDHKSAEMLYRVGLLDEKVIQ